MPKLKYLRTRFLTTLQGEVPNTLHLYEHGQPWLENYFKTNKYALESSLEITDSIKLVEPVGRQDLKDFENTRIIYDALKALTPLQASDARLWTYLTHATFWKHMRKRWPVEEKPAEQRVGYIKEHYFVETGASRALIRNGVANLWWYGFLTYDGQRDDPYALTRVLLSKLDIARNLLERTLGRNRNALHACLEVLLEHQDIVKGGDKGRDLVRDLVREMNFYGGVCILDHLDKSQIKEIATKKLEALTSK